MACCNVCGTMSIAALFKVTAATTGCRSWHYQHVVESGRCSRKQNIKLPVFILYVTNSHALLAPFLCMHPPGCLCGRGRVCGANSLCRYNQPKRNVKSCHIRKKYKNNIGDNSAAFAGWELFCMAAILYGTTYIPICAGISEDYCCPLRQVFLYLMSLQYCSTVSFAVVN